MAIISKSLPQTLNVANSGSRENRNTTREVRDAHQRAVAKQKWKDFRKSFPKRDRSRDIQREREEKMWSRMDEVEEQGFGHIAVSCAILAGGELFRVARGALRSIRKASDEGNDTMRTIKQQFKSVAESAKNVMGVLYVVPVAIFGLWCLCSTSSILVQGVILSALAGIIGPTLWKHVSQYFTAQVAQSGFDMVPTLVATLMSCVFLPLEGPKMVPEILRRIGFVPRVAQGFDAIFKAGVGLVEKIYNIIARAVGKEQRFFGDSLMREVKAWCASVERLEMALINAKNDNPSVELIEEVFRKIQDGYHMKHSLSDDNMKLVIHRSLERLEMRLKPYESQLQAAKTFRVEPEFLLLYGASKQGKTTMLVRAAVSVLVLAELVEAKQVLSNMWQKGDTKYFESYCGQKCMIMDDVFQEKVIPGMEGNEFMQVIRMVGNWSYPLNMASVDLKAKFFFNSPVIIGTTNLPSIDATTAPQVIACKEAVSRRVHRCLKIEASEEYAVDGGLDYPKLEREMQRRTSLLYERFKAGSIPTKEEVLSTFPWEAWRATKWDWNTGVSTHEEVDLHEYFSEMAACVRAKIDAHTESVENLNRFSEMLGAAAAVAQSGLEETQHSGENFVSTNEIEPAFVAPATDHDTLAVVSGVVLPGLLQRLSALSARWEAMDADSATFDDYHAVYREFKELHTTILPLLVAEGGNEDGILEISRAAALRGQHLQYVLDTQYPGRSRFDLSVTQKIWRITMRMLDLAVEGVNRFMDGCVRMLSAMEYWVGYILGLAGGFVVDVALIGVTMSLALFMRRVFMKLVGVVCDLFRGLKNFLVALVGGFKESTPQEQSNVAGTERKTRKPVQFRTKLEEQGFDGTQFEQKHNRVYANTFNIVVDKPDAWVEVGQLIFIQGQLAVMPAHFIRQMAALDKELVVRFISASDPGHVVKTTIGDFLEQRMKVVEGQDICFVNFSREWFRPMRKIVKYFMSAEQLDAATRDAHPVRMDLCSLCPDGTTVTRVVQMAPKAEVVSERTVGPHVYKNLLTYSMSTSVGMCGAPISICDPKYFNGRTVMGFHIAGNIGFVRKGYAVPVTTELIGEALKFFNIVEDDKFEEDLLDRGVQMRDATPEEQSGLTAKGVVGGSFQLLGIIDKGVNLAPFSKLKRSPIGTLAPFGPIGKRPAILGPLREGGVVKYPMVEGLRNYQTPMEVKRFPWIEQVIGVASLPFREATRYETRRLFSFEEAAAGVEGLKIKAVNRSSSPGFPYVWNVKSGKTEFFGKEGPYDFTSPQCKELRKRVDYIIEEAAKGVRLAHVCVDFLKDELRPDAKVDACQTRVISGSPIDYVLACRVMFGAFIAANFRHHTVSGLCPGINPYQDWWQLVQHLKRGEPSRTKFFDGDFKRFDASEQPYMHWWVLDIINRWYDDGPRNARIREVLWLDVVHSRHLSGAEGVNTAVVQWNKSLPSGHPLTTIINSWVVILLLFSCYLLITGQMREFREAWAYFSPGTFGDDNVAGVSDVVADVFNQVTVARTMKDVFNLTYTSGSKDGTLEPYKTLEECTFLKRSFVRDLDERFNGWIAPLDKGSFLFTSYYYKNNRGMSSELAKKLDGTLGELCLHDEATWDEFAPQVMSVMRDVLGVEPMYETRDGFRNETYLRDDVWF